jgi:hypothetical protein
MAIIDLPEVQPADRRAGGIGGINAHARETNSRLARIEALQLRQVDALERIAAAVERWWANTNDG